MRTSHRVLLSFIADAGGSVNVADIVRRHPGKPTVARASTSRTLRRLSFDGYIHLAQSDAQPVLKRRARAAQAMLTERGRAAAHKAMVNTGGIHR